MTRKSNPWLLLICMYLAGMELSACAFIGPKHEEEPQCYSRFDFEYKTVQKLVALENAYSELKTTTDQVLAELGNSKKDNAEEPKTIYAQVQLLGENTMTPGQKVKFTGTIANIGEAFKTSQGYFEAPYDGTYLFTVNLCMRGNNWVVFRIVQDNYILSESHPGDNQWHACASATAATYMRVGSKVWAEIDRVHGGVLSSSYGISSFTGVFLNNFQKP